MGQKSRMLSIMIAILAGLSTLACGFLPSECDAVKMRLDMKGITCPLSGARTETFEINATVLNCDSEAIIREWANGLGCVKSIDVHRPNNPVTEGWKITLVLGN